MPDSITFNDDPIRAAEELASRVLNPEAAAKLPGSTEDHARYVLGLVEQVPTPPTPEQVAAATKLAELRAERAEFTVRAAIEGDKPDPKALVALDKKIEIATALARGDAAT